jgi:hypothetical protein
VHPGPGTQNAIVFHEEDYLELLSVRDRDEYLSGHPGGGLLEFLARRVRAGGQPETEAYGDAGGGAHAHHSSRRHLTSISQDSWSEASSNDGLVFLRMSNQSLRWHCGTAMARR